MRGESPPLRGESGRVAARVRELVGNGDGPATPRDPERSAPSVGDRLAALLPVRVDPGRRTALAVGAAVLLAAILTGLWVLHARPRSLAVSAPASDAAAGSAGVPALSSFGSPAAPGAPTATSAPSSASSAADVVVDVAGRVHRPGLYSLPAGSRIDDALTAAGGARPGVDLRSLNLAAPLVDGEQIVVGHAAPAGAGGVVPPAAPVPGAPAASSTAIAPVSLNTATLEQLETLPGVGPVTGQKILDYRSAHGSFTSVDQLKDVSGIGDVTFAELAPFVTL